MLNIVLSLVAGFILGLFGALVYGGYLVKKAERTARDALEKAAGTPPPPPSSDKRKDVAAQKEAYAKVKPRLDRAAQITQEQAELMAQIDMPSKNSLHSKFKNGLVAEAKKLEEEKTELLRSIIADGFDPEITVQVGTGLQRMHLSEYLQGQGYDVGKPATNNEAPPTSEEKPAEEPSVRKVGNFFVIKGGKNDTSH